MRDRTARARAELMRGPKPTIVPSGWYTPEEAMAKLSIAERTLRDWAIAGRLTYRTAAVPGQRPRRLYKAEDVDMLHAAQAQAPKPKPTAEPGSAIERRPPRTDILAILTQLMATMNQQKQIPAAPAPAAPARLWLTIDEAHELSGLSKAHLLRLCQDSQVQAVKSPAWMIRRASLEAFEG